MPIIITENDISEWDDRTGERYHFPGRYLRYLQPGTPVIYYKGKQRDARFSTVRLSNNPYYFGVAVVGSVFPDPESTKGDYFCSILNYRAFSQAVPIRDTESGNPYEEIPSNRINNFWRDGVRVCSQEVYERILSLGGLNLNQGMNVPAETNDQRQGGAEALESIIEDGTGRRVYGTRYERNRLLRAKAIQEHGIICKACGFDYGAIYGEHGQGYIHVHHLKPISETGGPTAVNPREDMTVLCANCHMMVHRYPGRMLTVEALIAMIQVNKLLI